MREPLLVNGFPKSGNTWMARLFAECLNSPAGSVMPEADNVEAATEGKHRLGRFKVMKGHLNLSQVDLDKFPKVVVPVRDVRDVLISQYFHQYITLSKFPISKFLSAKFDCFEFLYDFFQPEREKVDLSLRRSFLSHMRKYFYRKTFEKDILMFSDKWTEKKIQGRMQSVNWSTFNWEWLGASVIPRKNDRGDKWGEYPSTESARIVFVKYEDLLADPVKTVVDTLTKLNVGYTDEGMISRAVFYQSFEQKKAAFEGDGSVEAPRGKRYNKNFLREGKSGSYKHFLHPDLEESVVNSHEEVLRRFGYLSSVR